MSAHSPLPWVLEPEDRDGEINGYDISAADHYPVLGCEGILGGDIDAANAALIVRAVNAHDELVARNNTLDDRVAALNLCLDAMQAVQAELVAALRDIAASEAWTGRAPLAERAKRALAKLDQPA